MCCQASLSEFGRVQVLTPPDALTSVGGTCYRDRGMANNLRRLRVAAEISQEKLAREINVANRTVVRWERGESQIPAKHWGWLADRFGVSQAYLLGIDGNNHGGERRAA